MKKKNLLWFHKLLTGQRKVCTTEIEEKLLYNLEILFQLINTVEVEVDHLLSNSYGKERYQIPKLYSNMNNV